MPGSVSQELSSAQQDLLLLYGRPGDPFSVSIQFGGPSSLGLHPLLYAGQWALLEDHGTLLMFPFGFAALLLLGSTPLLHLILKQPLINHSSNPIYCITVEKVKPFFDLLEKK